jgi:hypothetical protein
MDATTKETLVKAINFLKTGDKQSAVPLLANVLKKEPNLVQAWYLLGLAMDSEAQKIKAFKQALKLDPDHAKARQALAKLETPPPVPESVLESEPEPEPEPAPIESAIPPLEKPIQTDRLDQTELEIRSAFADGTSFEETPETDFSPADESPEMDIRSELSAEPGSEYESSYETSHEAGAAPEEELSEPAAEFALPAWMSESTFDPSDYQAGQDAEAEEIYENTAAEIPEWAKMNPFASKETPSAFDPEPEPEPEPEQEEEVPPWAGMVPDSSQAELFEDDEVMPSWATSEESFMDEDTPDQYSGEESDYDRVSAFFEEEDAKSEEEETTDSPEEPDWLRGMVDEEDGKGKKSRKKQLTPSQKKHRLKIFFRVLALILIVGGAVAGYIFRDELQPYWAKVKPYTDKVVHPVQTWAAPATDLLTQGAPLTYLLTPDYNVTPTVTNTPPSQPTAAPTLTPRATSIEATATLRSTLGPDETPTVTPTSNPLPSEIITQLEEIESQIKILRGLDGPATINREMLSLDKLRQDMENQLIDPETLAEFEDDLIVLKSLGFIRDDVNLADQLLNTYADANGGFYSPANEKIYLLGSYFDGIGAIEQYVYALEYAHALQDHNFNLSNLGYYPKCKQAEQTCKAMNALIKGEAALVNQLWLEQNPPQSGYQDIVEYDPAPTLFGPNDPAPFFTQDAAFGTTHGLAFVQYLYENGGWNAVNRAFSILPSTTEQILHPEKYQQREEAGGIVYPSYIGLLGQEWELVREDSLGEWYSYLLLGYNDYPSAQIPDKDAAVAANGWSVDRYQVYYNPEAKQTFLSVYWIWDSVDEASQFYTALEISLNGRFGGAPEELSEGGVCWNFGGQKSCIQQGRSKVYWLLSEDAEMVDLVRGRFVVFP